MLRIQHPVSEAHLRALGRVAVAFSALEFRVGALLWMLISKDQRLGQVISAELSLNARMALISAIWRHRVHDDARVRNLEALLGRLDGVVSERNKLSHSYWIASLEDNDVTRLKVTAKRGKGRRVERASVTVENIDSIAALLEADIC